MTYTTVFAALAFSATFAACTSIPSAEVVERSDELSSMPEWATLENSHVEQDGQLTFLGMVEVDGDASKSAALNFADEKAMSEPLRALVDQFLDQNQVGESLRKDDAAGQRILSATRAYRPPMADLKILHRYWELVRVPNQDDPTVTKVELRAYSLAVLSKKDYEHAKQAYFARLKGDSEVKKILDEVGAVQRENAMAH